MKQNLLPAKPSRRLALLGMLATAVAVAAPGCGGGGGGATPTPAPPPPADPSATTFAQGLANPWGLAELPAGGWLVTERGGQLRRVSADGATVSAPLSGVPAVAAGGQGGLLDVVLDPAFDANRLVYLSYAESGSGAQAGLAGTAVARGTLGATGLSGVEVIFRQLPKVGGSGHFGARLVFARDGTLFVSLGERQQGAPAQDLGSHLGKVVRIARDGSLPADNPSFGAGAGPGLWSIGHRNPQGAALHPGTGELWIAEHGPQGGDEINIARAGANHGWPRVSYGCDYGATYAGDDNTACRIGGGAHAPQYAEPLSYWVPTSTAPAGMTFYTGSMFPEWRGNLFVTALAGRVLWRLTLSGNTVTAREPLFAGLGERLRAVAQGADGALYLLTDSADGRIVRIAR